MSLSADLLKSVLLPLSGQKAMLADPRRLEAAALKSQSAGPARPGLLLRRGLEVHEEETGGRLCFHCLPEEPPAATRVLYVHGGAYALELASYHWRIITELVRRTGVAFHVPVFPLAPRHRWDEAMAVLLATYTRLADGAGPLVLMGDSSGAAMALSLAQEVADRGLRRPQALVLLSPALDFTFSDPHSRRIAPEDPILATAGPQWAATVFSPSGDPADPAVSPLFRSFEGLPPVHMFAGSLDLTSPDAPRARARAEDAGVSVGLHLYEGMPHVWMSASIPEGAECRSEIADVLALVEQDWMSADGQSGAAPG